jgi:diguanylate cyclase (GGDEF)-like protein
LIRLGARSFKFKLVLYFVLLSLLPAAAAFWGFSAVAKQSEVRRVDARLQSGLRAAIAAYGEDLDGATRQASRLANDPALQRALDRGDAAATQELLRNAHNVRVETSEFVVGDRPVLAAERRVRVVGPDTLLGYVIAMVPFDQALLRKVKQRSGLGEDEQFIVVHRGRLVVGAGWTQASLDVPAEQPTTVSIDGKRQRVLIAATRGHTGEPTLGVTAPQDAIDAAAMGIQQRLLLGLLAALLLIAFVAYVEGRSVVRTVSSIARAANAIARGKYDERVPVRGRDELARLGNSFNQMADQLQFRLQELESERRRLRDAISRFGDALAATHDSDQLLRAIVETAVEATGASGGVLIGADGEVVEVGTPGAGSDQLELPLRASKSTFGTLFLFGRHFDEESRLTAASLVGQSVIALDNANLHRIVERQALVDGLTGLANRRQAEDALATELSRADRFGGPLSVVIGDLDDFKAVNDDYGHPVGDTVLREFARVLDRSVRDVDVAARWGGEEFLLVLPGTDADGAVRLAQRIREHLADTNLLSSDGLPIWVTASFGVAEAQEESGPADLVAAADAALYEAKRSGKDRVRRAPVGVDVHDLR